MGELAAIPSPTSSEEPYEVARIERRTPTIVELELWPRGESVEYLPGEYVLVEDDLHQLPRWRPGPDWRRSALCSRPGFARARAAR